MTRVHTIKVPDVGEGIAEVELVAWHVQVGDLVQEDQPLADVMTDKASVEIPSSVSGRVLALGGEVGRMMAVGGELIRIELGDTAQPAAADPYGVSAAVAAPVPEAPAELAKPATGLPVASAPAKPEPAVPSLAVSMPAPPQRAKAASGPAGQAIASPALRRRAWELGVDLKDVAGSGPGGRILQADLDAHVATRGDGPPAAALAPAPAAAKVAALESAADRAVAPPIQPTPGAGQRHDEQAVPVIGLRRRIAVQMQQAKRHIPHFSYVEEVDVTDLEALRGSLNTRYGAERGRLTLLPLLMRALVLAVRDHPHLNARFDDEAGIVTRYGAVHLGIATDTRHGLLVPVVRHAEALSVWAMAAEVARLAEAARSGKATRGELSGSTLTISSLGALGGIVSTPVINRPEVAIVGVNRMVERPVLRGGAVVARLLMNLSSSFDHRVVDGIDAARFIQDVRQRLEAPALLFVE